MTSSKGNSEPTESTVRCTLRDNTGTTWALTGLDPRVPSSAARLRAHPPAATVPAASASANPAEARFTIDAGSKSNGFGAGAP